MPSDADRALPYRYLLPRSVRRLPADLAGVLGLVGLTCVAVLIPGVRDTPLRIIVGLPFVLFVPGYAFIAALFPEQPSPADVAEGDDQHTRLRTGRSIDGIERVALAFGTSIAIVPLLGLILNFTPWGIRLVPVLLTVSGFTVIATAVAARRRWALPEPNRFTVPYRAWLATARTELFESDTRTDRALNILLVLSVVLASLSVTYAVAVPKQGEAFTEFYILTENETGELVADDYPTEFTAGETKPIHVGIGNHEHQQRDYTVVVALQRVQFANNSTQVLAERALHRTQAIVAANATWHRQLNLTPTMTGQRLRLVFLLYRDDPPAQPTVANAYRELHLWINVSQPNQSAQLPPHRSTERETLGPAVTSR